MNLTVEKVLIYYDVPQLFSAKDAVGSHYLCLLVDDSDDKLQYLTIQISKEKLTNVATGGVDLRETFAMPELGKWLMINNFTEDKAIALETNFQSVPEDFLPEAG